MRSHCCTKTLFLLLFLFLSAITFAPPTAAEELIGGLPPEQAYEAGKRMYRQGLLPSGEPMEALVQGDILMDGTMFTCENCHLRSGLGSLEGNMIVYPTNAAKLFIPLRRGAEININPAREKLSPSFQGGDARPAYTEETLAASIWEGTRSDGSELLETMPRYPLDDKDMEILVYYLKNLSAEYSPGVTENSIQLATVITDDVSETDRRAMLDTLKAYIRDKSSQSRHDTRRSKQGPWYRQERFTSYRELVLTEWRLTGPPGTWQQQLQAYYAAIPVFALVGGISNQDWQPIHDFCEQNTIPCIFPITNRPVISKTDWYTLYFSKGYYQEGETVAKFLRGTGNSVPPENVVQLISDTPAGRNLAKGFRETWQLLNQPEAKEILIKPGSMLDDKELEQLLSSHPGATYLFWLEAEHLDILEKLAAHDNIAAVYASAEQLGETIYRLEEAAREKLFLTYPYRLPEERKKLERIVTRWLQAHKLPVTNLDIQSKVYFIGWMLSGGFKMMLNEYYRDYFLDILDMMNDEYFAIVNYPRVSFGQGQRYAVKGCYIVQLSPGENPTLLKRSDWVVH